MHCARLTTCTSRATFWSPTWRGWRGTGRSSARWSEWRQRTGSSFMSDQTTDQPGLAQAARWFALAVEDLEGVRVIVRDHVMVARIGGFPAQKSAQKAIKAALIAQGTDPPKSHLLTDLFALLADAPPFDVRE